VKWCDFVKKSNRERGDGQPGGCRERKHVGEIVENEEEERKSEEEEQDKSATGCRERDGHPSPQAEILPIILHQADGPPLWLPRNQWPRRGSKVPSEKALF